MSDPKRVTQSGWKTFLDFLWDGGFRSTIVLSVTLGAIVITVGSDKFCRSVPLEVPIPVESMTSANPTPADQRPVSAPRNTDAPIQAATQQIIMVSAQPNPICAKYFELAFMVVGGYLGLSTPKSVRTGSQGSNSSDSEDRLNEADVNKKQPENPVIQPTEQP